MATVDVDDEICPICLEGENHGEDQKLTIVRCENGHFLHSGCFSTMACKGLKLKCPVCRGDFKCETCNETLHRLICLRCYVDLITGRLTEAHEDPHRMLYTSTTSHHYHHHMEWIVSRQLDTSKLEVIIQEHVIWAFLSMVMISYVISLWPLKLWTKIGTINFIGNVLLGYDRVIVEILKQIGGGEGSGLIRVLHIVHGMIRLLMILISISALQNGLLAVGL